MIGGDLLAPLDPARWVPLAWDGDGSVPRWRAIRSTDTISIVWEDGHVEAYDVVADPAQTGEPPPDPADVQALRALARHGAFTGPG